MTIDFHCPNCDKFLRTTEDKAGLRANCPECGESLHVPEPISPASKDVAVITPTGTAKKLCPMCGGEDEESQLQCRYCGEDFLEHGERRPFRDRDRFEVDQIIPAGFFRRTWAMILDFFLLALMTAPAAFLASMYINNDEPGELMIRFIFFVVSWPYYALFESSSWRGTPGKRVFNMIVTDTNGEQLSFARASGRHFGKILSRIICYAGYFMAAIPPEKQALHDLISGCLVLKKTPKKQIHPTSPSTPTNEGLSNIG